MQACVPFHNKLVVYGEFLAPRKTSKLEGHPFSAVHDCSGEDNVSPSPERL